MTAIDEFAADPAAAAIAALTAAARQTRVRGAGTDQAAVEPADFADIAAHVLTTVAANLGSVETLLAGRPGSWEADLVRQLVNGTAGERYDELLPWRTEPVRLWLDTWGTLDDFGIAGMYDQELDQAAAPANDPSSTDAEREASEDLCDAINDLWDQDEAAYAAAYLTAAQAYLTERGATCGVELADAYKWDGLAEQIEEYARKHAPLPMTGSAPDWSDGTPADALRRAGLTYTDRARTGSGE